MSLVVIGIVAGVTLGITGAYFSDTATSTSNSFRSGTLNLRLANDGKTSFADSVTGTFEMSNMAPGVSTATGKVWLENTGTVPAAHVSITSVVNTPSDNAITEPECKAYNGEWKSGFSHGWCCVLPRTKVDSRTTCENSYGGIWGDTGDILGDGKPYHCYAEGTIGFKDGKVRWNDVDKYLQITSIKYAGQELTYSGGDVVDHQASSYVDKNNNDYLDLDDLETVAKTAGSWLHNLTPAPGVSSSSPHTFEMTVKLHEDAGNVYQTDKDGIEITFQLNQNAS